jgi:hypothetical protein
MCTILAQKSIYKISSYPELKRETNYSFEGLLGECFLTIGF